MIKCILLLLFNAGLLFTVQADTKCNLAAIFQTPRRRNYDEFEIIERSNFPSDLQGDKNEKNYSPTAINPNSKILLKLGDYKNFIRKNNNNVNTRITLAAPNHNNYYQPLYPHILPQPGYPWNVIYPSPATHPQYYIDHPEYLTQYQFLSQNVPVLKQILEQPQIVQKPKIFLNDPVVLESSSIQHIPVSSQKKVSNAEDGALLNTMTVIPKIIIDTVANNPKILKDLNVQNNIAESKPETSSTTELPQEEIKEEIKKSPKTPEEDSLVSVASPRASQEPEYQIYEEPQDNNINEENLQVIGLSPVAVEPQKDATLEAQPTLGKESNVINDTTKTSIIEEVTDNTSAAPTLNKINNVDHPRVLHPVKLSNNIENVEILGAGSVNISLSNDSPQRVEKCTNFEDLELVELLRKSLVPLISLETKDKPKLLVSYPVINNFDKTVPEHPSAIIIQSATPDCSTCENCRHSGRPRVDVDDLSIIRDTPIIPGRPIISQSVPLVRSDGKSIVSGYQISSASGFYEDPSKRIIYNPPTEISVMPPQIVNGAPIVSPIPNLQNFMAPPPDFPKSSLMDLLKYLLADKLFCPPTMHRCPYCSNLMSIPTDYRYSAPFQYYPYRAVSQPNLNKFFNPPSYQTRCPYCAKYRGELNQLEEI